MRSRPLNISTLCTFNDWAAHYGTWGEAGVNRVFDLLAIAGIKRVFWRALSGGLAEYPSKVAPVWLGRESTTMFGINTHRGGIESWHSWKGTNFDEFDALECAVKIGRERGIKVCAWMTIYEEDHGGACRSPIGSNEKYIQRDRAGRGYPGTADFFYSEVRDYKLKIVREILAYGVEGLLLDFARHNATPSASAQGFHRFGFNAEICGDFKRRHGVDPHDLADNDSRWLDYKTKYQTDFVGEVFRQVGARREKGILTWPVDSRQWLCLDLARLSREKHLDYCFPFSMRYSIAPHEVLANQRVLKAQLPGARTEVGAGLQSYFGVDAWDVEDVAERVRQAGITEILHSESDQMIVDRLTTSFRAIHLDATRQKREVKARRLAREPREADWSRQQKYAGFYVVTGPDRIKAAHRTEFQVLASPTAFYCRMYAHGPRPKAPRQVGNTPFDQYAERDAHFFESVQPFIQALGARLYWLGVDRGHLFLDPGHTGRKFFHFVADRAGSHAQQTNLDNAWTGKWRPEIFEPNNKLWTSEWKIPFETIGARPRPGDRWTFQIMRESAEKREISSWFLTTTPSCSGVKPYEWGEVVFE